MTADGVLAFFLLKKSSLSCPSCCSPLSACLTHKHTLHSSSCTLWSGNQAASNCNNWKNVPSGLFEHLLVLNFSHGADCGCCVTPFGGGMCVEIVSLPLFCGVHEEEEGKHEGLAELQLLLPVSDTGQSETGAKRINNMHLHTFRGASLISCNILEEPTGIRGGGGREGGGRFSLPRGSRADVRSCPRRRC